MTTPDPKTYFKTQLDKETESYFENHYQDDGKAPIPDSYFKEEAPAGTPPAPDEQLDPVYDANTPNPATYFESEPDEYQVDRDARMSRMTAEQQHMQYLIKMALASN